MIYGSKTRLDRERWRVCDDNGKTIFACPMPFEKRQGKYNGLNLNDDVCDKDKWTVEIIKARTDRMAKEILAMFAM